jgi:hypothetical protein
MVPTTQPDGAETPHHIREDVEEVETAAVVEEVLEDFRADAQSCGAGEEGKVHGAAAGGVWDPVEEEGEEEEG